MGGFVPLPVDQLSTDPSQLYGANPWSRYFPYANTDPNASMEHVFGQDRNIISSGANQLDQEAGQQLNYYGSLQPQFQQAQNASLNNLAQTPGYTPEEAAAVQGDPNQPVQNLIQNQEHGEGAMLNQYQSNLGGQLDQYGNKLDTATTGFGTGLTDASGRYRSNVSGAASGLGTGLNAAQGKFGALDTAVSNPALGFDPNQTEKQLSDQDVQDLQTQAMTSVGNQFRGAEDTLERQAAAQGETSPAQIAALRQAMTTQQAATAGDAATNARIAALQAQYGRAAGIEGQREGAVQTQTGLKATAATTEEAAAQAAAGQAGQANIAAQENIGAQDLSTAQLAGQAKINAADTMGKANVDAANQYGQFSTGEANTIANQQLGAQQTAESEAANRAANVAGARIAGEGAYRSGVAQQQGMAQQGGQAAEQQQLGTYGTMVSGLNQSASGQGSFETNKASLGDSAGKGLVNAVTSLFEHGGVAMEPTIAKLGERGPEMVVPLDRYKSMRKRDPQFAEAA